MVAPVVTSEPSTSVSAPTVSAAPEAAENEGLPTIIRAPAGPIVIRGYPATFPRSDAGYALDLGYTRDGSEVIAFIQVGDGLFPRAKDPDITLAGDTVFFRGAEKATQRAFGWQGDQLVMVTPTPIFKAKMIALKQGFIRQIVERPTGKPDEFVYAPPAVVAEWPFSDITLEAKIVRSKQGSDLLAFGGRVATEDPVFPITLAASGSTPPSLNMHGTWNAILTNPANTELALIGHFNCRSSCDDVVIERIRYEAIASLVYNDTGFRHHQKANYARARDAFLKATWVDPNAPLPPYNLACAYARLGEVENAEKALRLAIRRGGERVKGRAAADADFRLVANETWFRALVGSSAAPR